MYKCEIPMRSDPRLTRDRTARYLERDRVWRLCGTSSFLWHWFFSCRVIQ